MAEMVETQIDPMYFDALRRALKRVDALTRRL